MADALKEAVERLTRLTDDTEAHYGSDRLGWMVGDVPTEDLRAILAALSAAEAREEGRQSAGERVKGECLTPGCIYTIKIEPYARWGTFHRAHVNVRVGLPERVDMAAPSPYEGGHGDNAPWGVKQKAYLDAVEEIAHRHMEAAIAEIGAFDLTQGGTFAKDWPALLAPQAAPVEQGAMPVEQKTKRTMTLNLTDEEMAALEEIVKAMDVSPPKVFRHGLKLMQLEVRRLAADQKDGAS